MTNQCLNCNKEVLTGKSKYCSDSCKVLYNRKQRTVNNTTVNTVNVNNNMATVNSVDSAMLIGRDVKQTPDLIDACGNIHKRTMVNGVATVYKTMNDPKQAQAERIA